MAYKPKPITAGEMKDDWLAWQRKRHEHPELYAPKSTGLWSLNAALGGGIELGQYVLIGGEPGAGKTTLLEKISDSFGRQTVNSLFLTAEMTTMQLGTLYFCTYSGIDRTKVRAVGLEVADWEKLEIAGKEIEKLTLAFDYGFTSTADIHMVIDEIEGKTGELVLAVFGDYVHLMSEPGFRGTQTEELAFISKSLNRLKNSKNRIPRAVIFAAQLNRKSVEKRVISMTSFHGTAQFERDMDIGIIISNVRDEITPDRIIPNVKQLSIVKSRETGVDEPFEVRYNGSTATFSDKIKQPVQTTERYWA